MPACTCGQASAPFGPVIDDLILKAGRTLQRGRRSRAACARAWRSERVEIGPHGSTQRPTNPREGYSQNSAQIDCFSARRYRCAWRKSGLNFLYSSQEIFANDKPCQPTAAPWTGFRRRAGRSAIICCRAGRAAFGILIPDEQSIFLNAMASTRATRNDWSWQHWRRLTSESRSR